MKYKKHGSLYTHSANRLRGVKFLRCQLRTHELAKTLKNALLIFAKNVYEQCLFTLGKDIMMKASVKLLWPLSTILICNRQIITSNKNQMFVVWSQHARQALARNTSTTQICSETSRVIRVFLSQVISFWLPIWLAHGWPTQISIHRQGSRQWCK